MSFHARIEQRLTEKFGKGAFTLKNKSHLHEGHAGHDGSGDSHFLIFLDKNAVQNLSRIECHRMINMLLDDFYKEGLHSVSLRLVDGVQ